jgi:hypothetical protein
MKGYDGGLVIYTPFYKYEALLPYCMSLFQTSVVLERLGVKFDYWGQEGGFHIESAINSALTKFTESEYTDFLIIDSDESWNPQDVVKLLLRPEEVIGGTYRMKNKWQQYVGMFQLDAQGFPMGRMTSGNTAIIEADRIPSGFLRIKKEVLQKFIATYPDDFFYLNGEKSYKFFFNEIVNNQFTGMDYCFSDKIKSLGYRLWIDPSLEIDHWGMTEYRGNYDKHLRGLKAIQDVKKMAVTANG